MFIDSILKLRKATIVGCLGCFLASLSTPAILFTDHAPVFGAVVLFYGWWGLILYNFSWLANFFLVAAFVNFRNKKYTRATVKSIAGFGLGLLSLRTKEWWFNEGFSTPVIGFGIGYYLWMMSYFILALGAIMAATYYASPPSSSE